MRTERDIVVDQTSRWFTNSEWSLERFASDRLAPALSAAGLVELSGDPDDVNDYLRARKAWGIRVSRIFHGTQPFPLEWKWVWLSCLPEEYQRAARHELLALAGCLDVRLPEFVGGVALDATQARLGEVTKELGEFLASATPAHDGSYHRGDDPAAVDRMLLEGAEAIAALVNEMIAVSTGTGRPLPLLVLGKIGGR
ncbi:TPA: hypothetical protein NHP34_006073 [Pseudomonas aeruginosa]|nr:hypothetical protein [Pseudomonas aeruginosa]